MDEDSRSQRKKKNLKALVSRKLGFDSVKRNVLVWKWPKILSFRSERDSIRCEERSLEGSCLMKSLKSSFSLPLWCREWNFLSSSASKKYHVTPPVPLKDSCSLASVTEACNISCSEIEPSVERVQQQENLDRIKGVSQDEKDGEVRDCDDIVSEKQEITECGDGFCEEKEEEEEEEECGGGDESEEECDVQESQEKNKCSLRKKVVRNYPPPLPSLARTGNLPCHMPWIHLRSYKTDGRLVIQEVKVRHHEFFRAARANGRLTLHLVQHDEGKIRAHQQGLFKAEAKEEAAIDTDKEDIDCHEENKEEGAEEKGDEAENSGKTLEGTEKQNGCTDIGEKVEMVKGGDEGRNEVLPCCRSFARENLIPDSLQMQRQRFSGSHLQVNSSAVGYGSKGLESPVGCCSPISANPFFDRPISTIRPILS